MIRWAKCTAPVDIAFDLPEELGQDQKVVCINGPHGPLHVPVPEGTAPGERVTIRIGPASTLRVSVPEGSAEGDVVTIEGPSGPLQAVVPHGLKPGDTFHVSPPVLMVQVPTGAVGGERVKFLAPGGRERMADVPKGALPGQYFEVPEGE